MDLEVPHPCPVPKMSALRVVVFFEGSELDISILPWSQRFPILHACNALWKCFETEDVNYRTLPEDDGELYVTPGKFHECQCSDAESKLDDHHFYSTMLPEDIREKNMLYDDGGLLVERKLVGGLHPLYDPMSPDALTGILARFDVVDWSAV